MGQCPLGQLSMRPALRLGSPTLWWRKRCPEKSQVSCLRLVPRAPFPWLSQPLLVIPLPRAGCHCLLNNSSGQKMVAVACCRQSCHTGRNNSSSLCSTALSFFSPWCCWKHCSVPSSRAGLSRSLAVCLLLVAARKKAKIYSAVKVLMNMQTVGPEILLIPVTGYT